VRVAVASLAPAVSLAFALLLATPEARADSSCITAYEQTQTLRKDGKPLASKAQAAICSRESCPALLTKDCTKWLAELDAVIPTVVLDVRTPAGVPRTDVRVKLDGAPLPDKNEGKPIPLEPGAHSFVIEADGAPRVERTLVLKEGEKNKKLTVTVAAAPESAEAKSAESRPVPIGVWVFGGASIVALATSAVFTIDGLGKKSDLDACKPRCAASDVDAMSSSFTLADVALGAGVMAGAAAVYLFLTRPAAPSHESNATPSASARARATPFAAPLPGGGAVGVTALF
jgi:hypothetical protein